MSTRRQLFAARVALATLLAAALHAPVAAQSPAELPPESARLLIEVYLQHARNGGVGTEFLRVVNESRSEWLILGITPELTTYCMVPDALSGTCYTEPHTLVLAVFVGNLLEDRSVPVQLQVLTPNLRAADPSSHDLPTVGGVKLYSSPLRYARSDQAVVPMVWDEVLLPPGDSQYVGLVVGFDDPGRFIAPLTGLIEGFEDPGRFIGVLTFELIAVPLIEPDAGSDVLTPSEGREGK